MKKLLIATMLLSLGLAPFTGSVHAQAEGKISFGIRPTKAFEDRPETFSYFSHMLAPGAVLTDEALVINSGEVPVTLKLYAADGITAVNGGTAFAQPGKESGGDSRGVSRWLSLSATEISLDPGEEVAIPFTINVPADASPGQYVAGLVLGAPPTAGGEGQFVVNVVRQSGVAVVIDVPGAHIAGLEISGASLRQQDEQGATFVVAVQNTGNIILKAEGSLQIMDHNGAQLAVIPLEMDTVLPGDATTFQITYPIHLIDGNYLITTVLNYEDETASLDELEVNVKNGSSELEPEPEPEESVLLPRIFEVISALTEEDALPIGRYAIYGAPLLISTVLVMAFVNATLSRKRHRIRKLRKSQLVSKSIVVPIGLEKYKSIVADPTRFRACLDEIIAKNPELFPPQIVTGYTLHDQRGPIRLPDIDLWRITPVLQSRPVPSGSGRGRLDEVADGAKELQAGEKQVFTIIPRGVMPYMTATRTNSKKARFPRRSESAFIGAELRGFPILLADDATAYNNLATPVRTHQSQ